MSRKSLQMMCSLSLAACVNPEHWKAVYSTAALSFEEVLLQLLINHGKIKSR